MNEKEFFHVSLDSSMSLKENVQKTIEDCEVMIDIFRNKPTKAEYYVKKRDYLVLILKEFKNDR